MDDHGRGGASVLEAACAAAWDTCSWRGPREAYFEPGPHAIAVVECGSTQAYLSDLEYISTVSLNVPQDYKSVRYEALDWGCGRGVSWKLSD